LYLESIRAIGEISNEENQHFASIRPLSPQKYFCSPSKVDIHAAPRHFIMTKIDTTPVVGSSYLLTANGHGHVNINEKYEICILANDFI
jgi:hypothetical protein